MRFHKGAVYYGSYLDSISSTVGLFLVGLGRCFADFWVQVMGIVGPYSGWTQGSILIYILGPTRVLIRDAFKGL